MVFTLTSPVFADNGEIPILYTCEGEDISPPLRWTGVPPEAKSLVLIVDDPDAPDPAHPKMTWLHWVLYNLPAELTGLAEGISRLPGTSVTGVNSWNRHNYGGPCPPIGRHRYFFKLYAIDRLLDRLVPGSGEQVEAAMRGHVLSSTQIMGTYQKTRK
ncbi:YbhB/YbcL family Raf kinase inhibitor-like protein [Rhizobium sp. S95]|uniref:YbhB/YbcL family Raf kinase inhibitor-like protein n=1 Tax=Ciceribacter sichuanensis TaxID=2949647 RepID=A0AAJ1F9E0_9HYPH|nr:MULTISPECIES: YbhB/YbcL family Raf kinase inhibitor-like protein [unclassified Ciceribacter]MCM2396605.1 YbhB/YbcL family Raf kinase inhibitor-like protein [Ciceribacter sp. S95]MCO5959902.1 YbhB/YbcL family Raf kinase inhibitor-like protein [Ciceribacter sp. S101]